VNQIKSKADELKIPLEEIQARAVDIQRRLDTTERRSHCIALLLCKHAISEDDQSLHILQVDQNIWRLKISTRFFSGQCLTTSTSAYR